MTRAHDPYAAFRSPSYRRYVTGWFVTLLGTRVQSVAVGWDVYQRTGEPFALALVGSHARGDAKADSDVDLLLLLRDPEAYLDDRAWVSEFGAPDSVTMESWGKVTSLRVFYADGLEVELGREAKNHRGFIAIRPEDIVLSREPLKSSMRNTFPGKITGIFPHGFFFEIHIKVNDILLKSLITKKSIFLLNIKEDIPIYCSFKTAALHDF